MCSLLLYTEMIFVCLFYILQPCWTHVLVLRKFFVDFLKLSVSLSNRDSFISSVCLLFPFFVMDRTPRTMLNKMLCSWFILWWLSVMLDVVFLYFLNQVVDSNIAPLNSQRQPDKNRSLESSFDFCWHGLRKNHGFEGWFLFCCFVLFGLVWFYYSRAVIIYTFLSC